MTNKIIKRALPYLVSILFLFLSCIPCAFSSTQPNITSKYYDISGKQATKLRQEMNRKRPFFKGRRYDEVTDWYVRWHYQYKKTATGCLIAAAVTSVDIVYQLPRWINPGSADSDLTSKWDNYIAALKLHEEGHAAIGQEEPKKLKRFCLS